MRIAAKPFNLPKDLIRQIKFISPNIYELNTIATYLGFDNFIDENFDIDHCLINNLEFIKSITNASEKLSKYVDNVITTCGSNGILITRKSKDMIFFDNNLQYDQRNQSEQSEHRLYPVEKIMNIVNVSGAGDSFNVGFIVAMINSKPEGICISVGMEAAKAALSATSAVPEKYFDKNHECWRIPCMNITVE